jgi:hypothetical protein
MTTTELDDLRWISFVWAGCLCQGDNTAAPPKKHDDSRVVLIDQIAFGHPQSHLAVQNKCLLRAKSGLMRRHKLQSLFSHLVSAGAK